MIAKSNLLLAILLFPFNAISEDICNKEIENNLGLNDAWRLVELARVNFNEKERELDRLSEESRSQRESALQSFKDCDNDLWRINDLSEEAHAQMINFSTALNQKFEHIQRNEVYLRLKEEELDKKRIEIGRKYSPSTPNYRNEYLNLIDDYETFFCTEVSEHQENKRNFHNLVSMQASGYSDAATQCEITLPPSAEFIVNVRSISSYFANLISGVIPR